MPHTPTGWSSGSVQQGLSAAGGALGFYQLGLAADQRCLFGIILKEAYNMTKTLCALALAGFLALLGASTEAQSQGKIKVLSDEPLQAALVPIAEAFRQRSGHEVEHVIGPSPAAPTSNATSPEVAKAFIAV